MAPAQWGLKKSTRQMTSPRHGQSSHRSTLNSTSSLNANENRWLEQHLDGTNQQAIVPRSIVGVHLLLKYASSLSSSILTA